MIYYARQRLSINSQICTVRYIGDVEGTDGSWIGVEWDDPTRGKHDGTHQGKRYFTCRSQGQTAASFIRPTRTTDGFLSFSDALQGKYMRQATVTNITKSRATYFNTKLAEEVGFEKFEKRMANLRDLQTISLDGFCIKGILSAPHTTAQPSMTWLEQIKLISTTCPYVKQLDIRRNLLESLLDIQGLCSALPELRSLDISGNRPWKNEVISQSGETGLKTCFVNMNDLSMDFTFMPWNMVCCLVKLFPSLQRLTFAYNEINEINEPLPASVSTLVLTGNNFVSFRNLAALSAMTSLETLILHNCPICDDNDTELQPTFESVRSLDVSDTKIAPKDLGRLYLTFPNLSSLRCITSSEENTLTIIARLGNLGALNSAKISHQQRMNAELYYLSSIAREVQSANISDEEMILAGHPRWAELCRIHGEPLIDRSTNNEASDNSLRARLVNLTCRDCRQMSKENSRVESSDTFQIMLPRSFSMYRVYMHISQHLSTLPVYLNIIWETAEPGSASDDECKQTNDCARAQHATQMAENASMVPINNNDSHHWPELDASEYGNSDFTTAGGVFNSESAGRQNTWVKKEVCLERSNRVLGFWIEDKNANIRIEDCEWTKKSES